MENYCKTARLLLGKIMLLITVLFISFNLRSQNLTKKRNAVTSDYKLWSQTVSIGLSDSGQWYSYKVHYEDGADTLFVKDLHRPILYFYPQNRKSSFIGEKWFCSLNNTDQLSIVNLDSGKKEVISNVLQYEIAADNKLVIVVLKTDSNNKTLLVKTLEKTESYKIQNVLEYAYNAVGSQLIYSTISEGNCRVFILNTDKYNTDPVCESSDENFYNFIWQQNGASSIFLSKASSITENLPQSQKIICYKPNIKKLYTFQPEQSTGSNLSPTPAPAISELVLSQDGQSIFFKLKNQEIDFDLNKKSIVQVWNAADKYLPPVSNGTRSSIQRPKTAVWYPEKQLFKILTDTLYSELMLSYGQKYAVLWNPSLNEPQPNLYALRDYKSVDLATGEEVIFLRDFSYGVDKISLSPAGKYITYFKNGDWWLYNIEEHFHSNLTLNLKHSFSNEENDYPGEATPYGHPGWTPDDQSVLLYDKFDIWEISPHDLKTKRITFGREINTQYRIIHSLDKKRQVANFDGTTSLIIYKNKDLLLQAKNKNVNGLYWLTPKNTVIAVISGKNKISAPLISQDGKTIVYREENFDLSPQMMRWQKNHNTSSLIYQSNPHSKNFNQGRSEVINYRNSKGQIIHAAIFFPSDYTPSKNYPMIVYIYSRQSEKALEYVNPSLYSSTGFNISNYTNNGYFVLLPDIIYESGNPGKSAVDCVVSGTKKALESFPIDPKAVGLIGHSFGAYEADFIITQTDLFSAAVAGAAITDMVSSYFHFSVNYSRPNFFQYESSQLRMGESIFKNFMGYLSNSPIYYADKVNTPLLSWAGSEDKQVHHYQTIEFYLALRRLGKKHVMLLYPEQGHTLTNKDQQLHLSKQIMEWFDKYLQSNSSIVHIKP
ncbi:prolyl oligopeptidase family serine peptidase [Flavobacterium johnsoniae]|uniref:alpha/beta hydrolase family protein n=1 Tax=Flavobacterium johnsoniae TaxID=986 RepID=UPI0025B23320|nr:prolyl oligopeptidase family serine peptidase [Flavobacterium johnsoniae]WJS93380.1 prolyl oligopeptidase family serine peptidase [Flavobacterium johnsoniae]